MSTWLAIPLLILVLVILGDGVAAFLAGRKLWKIRHRTVLALPLAIVLFMLALTSLNEVVNSVVNLKGVTLPPQYLIQSFIGRTLRAAATWYLALKLMSEDQK